jgi:hypothetical protein
MDRKGCKHDAQTAHGAGSLEPGADDITDSQTDPTVGSGDDVVPISPDLEHVASRRVSRCDVDRRMRQELRRQQCLLQPERDRVFLIVRPGTCEQKGDALNDFAEQYSICVGVAAVREVAMHEQRAFATGNID